MIPRPSSAWLSAALALASAWVVAAAQAGLSEATDFDGPWTTGGTSYASGPGGPVPSSGTYWVEQSAVSVDGTDAVEGRLGGLDGDSTWMETTVEGPATLYFSYRVLDFTAGYPNLPGGLSLSVEGGSGQDLAEHSGYVSIDSGWLEATATIPPGLRTVSWRLNHFRGSSPVRVYIDQVWPSTDPRPRLAGLPNQTCLAGTPFSMVAGVTSSTTATLATVGLPPGLVADPTTFVISGTPTTPGSYIATLTATNAAGQHVLKMPIEIEPETTTISQAADSPSLGFSEPEGSSFWGGVLAFSHDGVDAVRAAIPMRESDPGWLKVPLTTSVVGPGQLTFWYRTDERSSPPDWTSLDFAMGPPGSPTPLLSGRETSWTQAAFPVPAGPQVLTWSALRVIGFRPFQHSLMYVYLDSVEFTPTTIPPQATFAAWTTAWAVGALSATSDSDGDGLPLLMEYGSGGLPYTPNPELLPAAAMVNDHLTLRVTKAAAPTDLRVTVQGSADLLPESWSTDAVEILEEDSTHLLVRSKKTITEQPSFHLRVHVLLVP